MSRALLLLLKSSGGEETLTASHGIETVDWGSVMGGDIGEALRKITELKVRTKTGLFTDLLVNTKNRIAIHVSSASTDWRINYLEQPTDVIVTLGDIMSRMPDLHNDLEINGAPILYTFVNELSQQGDQFTIKIRTASPEPIKTAYASAGYKIEEHGDLALIISSKANFEKHIPQFIHTYVQKMFHSIPSLHIAQPLANNVRYSQLCLTFILSYILGMLVRYYPTHWVALIQGEKGDNWWPAINRAQGIVEETFPELAIELIRDVLKNP